MTQERPEMRNQPDEAQDLAELSVGTNIPVDKLPLRRAADVGREEQLRDAAKKKLLAMAGFTAEQVKTELHPDREAEAPATELSPEQLWFGTFQTRFDALPQLHQGVQWTDVEKSLRADPEAMRKLQTLDEKGHNMNVFGEENGEFVFVSGWSNYDEVSSDHRNVVFDKEAQKWLAKNHPDERCNGNATDIAEAMGVNLADTKFHEQLRKTVTVNGWAWLKTDASTRKTGSAFCGHFNGISGFNVNDRDEFGSFRVALRVKKA